MFTNLINFYFLFSLETNVISERGESKLGRAFAILSRRVQFLDQVLKVAQRVHAESLWAR